MKIICWCHRLQAAKIRFIDIYMEEDRLAYQARSQISQFVKDVFTSVSGTLAGQAPERITVFIGAGPFNPQTAVRSYYDQDKNQLYVLHDGSGNFADLNFQLTYGLSRLWGEQVWEGSPDTVLREGMAYSVADTRSNGSGNLKLCDVAWAYQQRGRLPKLTVMNSLDLEWTRNMVNLSTAGCYYSYLSETYGQDVAQTLYQSGDYSSMNSESFAAEESLFADWLMQYEPSQVIDTEMFVEQMDRLLEMNKLFFADFERWENNIDIYYALDQARLGLWRNDVRYAMVRMTTAGAMLGLTTHTVELTPTPEGTAEPSGGNAPTPEETKAVPVTPWPTGTLTSLLTPKPTDDK